jgi:hypothetical protein
MTFTLPIHAATLTDARIASTKKNGAFQLIARFSTNGE